MPGLRMGRFPQFILISCSQSAYRTISRRSRYILGYVQWGAFRSPSVLFLSWALHLQSDTTTLVFRRYIARGGPEAALRDSSFSSCPLSPKLTLFLLHLFTSSRNDCFSPSILFHCRIDVCLRCETRKVCKMPQSTLGGCCFEVAITVASSAESNYAGGSTE